jgi:broad specificity phosphatase PhoE
MATRRVVMVSHGLTAAIRAARFPLDEPLEEPPSSEPPEEPLGEPLEQQHGIRALRVRLPAGFTALSSPARRCLQTAELLGLKPQIEPALADWNLGVWAGRSLAELAQASPAAVEAWTTNPAAAPHGGESLLDLIGRVGAWLDDSDPDRPSRLLTVTDPAVIRAALIHSLTSSARSFWRIDVAPLSVAELRGRPGHWAHHLRS